MIQIEMDSDAAQTRLENMVAVIANTATETMPVEFVEWQENDMKRDFPNVEISGWSVMTRIWPRSRKSMIARRRQKFERPRVFRGLRPILRPEMFEALCDRMRKMLVEHVAWAKTVGRG
jgi:hypothetical protein